MMTEERRMNETEARIPRFLYPNKYEIIIDDVRTFVLKGTKCRE